MERRKEKESEKRGALLSLSLVLRRCVVRIVNDGSALLHSLLKKERTIVKMEEAWSER